MHLLRPPSREEGDALRQELATLAANALAAIPGVCSATALTTGFISSSSEVRAWCAYVTGEMALFGRRDDSLKIIKRLVPLVYDSSPRVNQETVHALGKIGGDIAIATLIDVLASPTASAKVKAYALHASRWWSRQEVMAFIGSISEIVKAYTGDQCNEIMQESRLQSAPSEVVSLLQLPKKDTALGIESFSSSENISEITLPMSLKLSLVAPLMRQDIFISYSHKDKSG